MSRAGAGQVGPEAQGVGGEHTHSASSARTGDQGGRHCQRIRRGYLQCTVCVCVCVCVMCVCVCDVWVENIRTVPAMHVQVTKVGDTAKEYAEATYSVQCVCV